MPPAAVKSINKLAHDHDVYVSTGGWIENVLRFGPEAVDRYVKEAKELGFDVIEAIQPNSSAFRPAAFRGSCGP